MNSSPENTFNAKILLFGEYSLLYGSMALSIPFDRYHGKFEWIREASDTNEARKSNEHIRQFFNYILILEKAEKLIFRIDTDRLVKDIDAGLYFKSNIPNGYGLGSSGAVVAAIFKKYGWQNEVDEHPSVNDLLELKNYFATLESYFHGQSSGLDPLISYLNKPILISEAEQVDTIDLKWNSKTGPGAVFLIDSGTSGETQPLVNQFRDNYKNSSFSNLIDNKLLPLVNKTIQSYIETDTEELIDNTRQISSFQIQFFEKMIPENVKTVWQNGLNTNTYSLKLCGSGGGGMMLGFTNDIKSTKKELGELSPITIHHI